MRHQVLRLTILALACLAFSPAGAVQAISLGDSLPEFSLYDTKRRLRGNEDFDAAKAIAIVFATTECPLVNLYLPKLKGLQEKYAPQGVQLVMVNADPGDSFVRVAGHRWERELNFPVLKDFDQSLAAVLGAKRTPEVFLFDGDKKLAYRGRIDDQFTVTHRRSEAEEHDFVDALEQVLAGETVSKPEVEATGCVLDYPENEFAGEGLTYHGNIAKIFDAKCLECHQKGKVGQISFTTYRQVKRFSKTIREVVSEQRMPPWFADSHYGEFRNTLELSDDERAQLMAWIDEGCERGEAPTEVAFREDADEEWTIGTPDLVLSMPEAEKVPATGVVDYKYYTVDPGFEEDVWIQAAEAKPGNAEVVHHVIAYVVAPGKRIFERDGETAILVGWAPGDMPAMYPQGIARRIEAGSKLRFELHYTPNGEETFDQSRVGIKFSKVAPQREIHTNIMWKRDLNIPAGASWHEERAVYKFRDDARILSLVPHMHLRGIAARYTLKFPGGKTETILSVPYYDFNWQSVYRFADPLQVPQGTELTVTGVWDNSADNPNITREQANQSVTWGEQTFEEMLNGWVDFVYEKADQPEEVAIVE